MADTKAPPVELFNVGVLLIGSGPSPRSATLGQLGNFYLNPTKECCLACLTSRKQLPCILEGLIVHKNHIECTLTSRPKIQYIYVHIHLVLSN